MENHFNYLSDTDFTQTLHTITCFEDPLEKVYSFRSFENNCYQQISFIVKPEKPSKKSYIHNIKFKEITQCFSFLLLWVGVFFSLTRLTYGFGYHQTWKFTPITHFQSTQSAPSKFAHNYNRVFVSDESGNFYNRHITKYSRFKPVKTALRSLKTSYESLFQYVEGFQNIITASNGLAYASISQKMVLHHGFNQNRTENSIFKPGYREETTPVSRTWLLERQTGLRQSLVTSQSRPAFSLQVISKNTTPEMKSVLSHQKLDVTPLLQFGIYSITNTKTNRVYIGERRNLLQRIGNHYAQLQLNTHYNKKLQHDWNDFKKENFKFDILKIGNEFSDDKRRLKCERSFIKEHLDKGYEVYNG